MFVEGEKMLGYSPRELHSCEKSLAKSNPLNGCWRVTVALKLLMSQVKLASVILLMETGIGYRKLGGNADLVEEIVMKKQ